MKNIIIFCALLFCSLAASAQVPQIRIRNMTNCPVQVTPVCYRTNVCTVSSICGSTVTINANNTLLMSSCICDNPTDVGYTVCWASVGCTGICTTVSDLTSIPCPAFPNSAQLAKCGNCGGQNGNAFITFNSAGDMVIY
jgi:hypothetical protein